MRNLDPKKKFGTIGGMKKVELTSDEKSELEKRGFLVKRNFHISELRDHIIYFIGYVTICVPLLGILSLLPALWIALLIGDNKYASIIALSITLLGVLYPLVDMFRSFVRTGITFQTQNGKIEYGSIMKKSNTIYRKRYRLFNLLLKIRNFLHTGSGVVLTLFSISFLLAIGSVVLFTYSRPIILTYSLSTDIVSIFYFLLQCAVVGLAPFIFLGGILLLSRYLFQLFSPLYAFGNLGEKIQKLTPLIGSKSKEIQKNFKKDMNFAVLSEGFDGLSSTFSQIVSLVIKLERVEKKANKGNLFDSEKYIDSLRSDILEPLESLKSFLEKKKEELLTSQKELGRVQVGSVDPETSSRGQSKGGRGQSELSSNTDLASKRSESLIQELTENIEKLDEMIGKMR